MKTFILPMIAGSMPVVAQSSIVSPFKTMSTAIETFDSVFDNWSGSLITMISVISALVTFKNSIDTICSLPGGIAIPQQSLPTQEAWLDDAQDFLQTLNESLAIALGKRPVLDGTLGGLGDPILVGVLMAFRRSIPICFNSTRTAFDNSQGQQQTLDTAQSNATKMMDKATKFVHISAVERDFQGLVS